MKKQVSKIVLGLAFMVPFVADAQEGQVMPCATYEAMELHFKENPAARKNYEAVEKMRQEQYLEYKNNQVAGKPAAAFVYTVPVVFHILHMYGAENISDNVCFAALDQVNKDFARLGSDTNVIFTPFKSLYNDAEIKFVPARKDPQGNCINGVVHHYDPKTYWSQNAAQNASYWTYTWDPTKYLNVYVTASIAPQSTVTGGGIIVGYTYKPGTWSTGNSHDAIVYRYDHLSGNQGSIPNARSLTHEIGHWLGLAHTFGNTNNPGVVCGDDMLNDTPPTKGNFGKCKNDESSNPAHTCSAPVGGKYYQNVENFMDYSNCARNFTDDQVTLMRNSLASSVSGRNNLSSLTNLAFTDIDNAIPCRPIADWASTNNSYTICSGGSLTMKDFSYNGTITAWAWSGDNNAVIASPTSSITSITFTNPGTTPVISNVTLAVSNSQGGSSMVRQVTVLDNSAAISFPLFESFEAPGLPADWKIENVDADNTTWQQSSNSSYHGFYSYVVEGQQNTASATDILEMPLINVRDNPANILEFAYAFRMQSSAHSNAQLIIEGSRDCGGTWQTIVGLSGNTMAQNSGGTSSDFFYPIAPAEWKIYTISNHPSWQNYKTSPNVLIRFKYIESTVGYGNNMYVDAVDFRQPVGINELTNSIGLFLYPNPTTSSSTLEFNLHNAADVSISVMDIVGREIMPVMNSRLEAGEQKVELNAGGELPSGIYIVNMTLNGARISQKLIVE